MKVLVTGGAGFIGSHVADVCLDEGHTVHVIDDLSTGRIENIDARTKFDQCDIGSSAFERIYSSARPDAVIHLAAHINVTESVAHPLNDANANILNTLKLLELCRRHRTGRIVYASSAAVYGATKTIPVGESMGTEPLSPYGVSKLACEEYIKLYGRTHGLSYVILRNSNVYGPRQIAHGECGVCAVFAKQMMAGDVPTLYGSGTPKRDYVYVDDVARANVAALTRGAGHVLNISSGEGVCVGEIFTTMKDLFAFDGEPNLAPLRPGEIQDTYLSNDNAMNHLGWTPSVDIDEGLRRTVEYLTGNTTTKRMKRVTQ